MQDRSLETPETTKQLLFPSLESNKDKDKDFYRQIQITIFIQRFKDLLSEARESKAQAAIQQIHVLENIIALLEALSEFREKSKIKGSKELNRVCNNLIHAVQACQLIEKYQQINDDYLLAKITEAIAYCRKSVEQRIHSSENVNKLSIDEFFSSTIYFAPENENGLYSSILQRREKSEMQPRPWPFSENHIVPINLFSGKYGKGERKGNGKFGVYELYTLAMEPFKEEPGESTLAREARLREWKHDEAVFNQTIKQLDKLGLITNGNQIGRKRLQSPNSQNAMLKEVDLLEKGRELIIEQKLQPIGEHTITIGSGLKINGALEVVCRHESGGDILTYLYKEVYGKRNSIQENFAQILMDLFYLMYKGVQLYHNANILHRDLSARNILVHFWNGKVGTVIADLGNAKRVKNIYQDYLEDHVQLAFRWMPQEVVTEGTFSAAGDILSLKIAMLECIRRAFGQDNFGIFKGLGANRKESIEILKNHDEHYVLSQMLKNIKIGLTDHMHDQEIGALSILPEFEQFILYTYDPAVISMPEYLTNLWGLFNACHQYVHNHPELGRTNMREYPARERAEAEVSVPVEGRERSMTFFELRRTVEMNSSAPLPLSETISSAPNSTLFNPGGRQRRMGLPPRPFPEVLLSPQPALETPVVTPPGRRL